MDNTTFVNSLCRAFLQADDAVAFSEAAAALLDSPLGIYSLDQQLLWQTGEHFERLRVPIAKNGRSYAYLTADLPSSCLSLLELAASYLAKTELGFDMPPKREHVLAAAFAELLTTTDARRLHSIRVRIGLDTFARDGHYLQCWLLNIHPVQPSHGLFAQLEAFFPGRIICNYRDLILVLMTAPTASPLSEQQLEKLQALLETAGALACCSDSFFEPFHDFRIQQHLERTEESIYYAQRSGISRGLIFYDSYKFPTMVHAALDAAPNLDNMQFVSIKVRQLLDYDTGNHTEFFQTLYHFLNLNLSYSHTAEKMFVHRNTIVYRVRQLEERFRIHFDDPDERFSLLLSCKIIRMLERKPIEDYTPTLASMARHIQLEREKKPADQPSG